ncbi:MAG: hypothetical protein FWC00_01605 [Firmicutes bacterium]|nr:hypothetical protein [Bacillota bacterium]
MSYYCNREGSTPGPIPGPITRNALDGLSNRVAISARRILDCCKKQRSIEGARLKISHMPSHGAPFVFQSATSTQVEAGVSNLIVTRLEERPSFARIQCDITVPMVVAFKDNDGQVHTTHSELTVHEDIVMYVPQASIFPFEIVASASCNCPTGEFDEEYTEAIVTACLTVITKVVADTDLLIPVYGYCPAPDAVDFDVQVCDKFFELPLYPSGK